MIFFVLLAFGLALATAAGAPDDSVSLDEFGSKRAVLQANVDDCSQQPKVFLGRDYTDNGGAPPFEDYFCFADGASQQFRGLDVAELALDGCVEPFGVQECNATVVTLYARAHLDPGTKIVIKPRAGSRFPSNGTWLAMFECPQRPLPGMPPVCVVPRCPVTNPDVNVAASDVSVTMATLLDKLGDNSLCQPALATAFRVSLATLLGVLMLGMGAGITFRDIKEIVVTRRPWPFVIGLSAQYVLMPLLAFAFAYAFQLNDAQAIGLVLTGCTSGGTTSQLFTKLAGGDMALSIVMTSVSTLLAFGMLPLLTYVYTLPFANNEGEGGGNIEVPFVDILLALLLVIVPVLLGLAIRHQFGARVGKVVEKVGTVAGMLGVLAAITMGIMLNRRAFDATPQLWACAVLLAFAGAFFGYMCSWLARLSIRHRRTVAIEVGIQNSSLTITVIALSFSGTVQADILQFPLLYSIWLFIDGAVLVVLFRLCNLSKACRAEPLGIFY